nr:unnamed protein product [Callosobruchus analis]
MIMHIQIFFLLLVINYGSCAKPNILLIIVDDLKPALGCFGDVNAYTPNIDRLAEKSFVFRNAFAQQALCAPSRNSLLTSRRPDSLHLYDFYSYWRSTVGNFTTMPQYFKENGYHTYSIGKVFHPGKSSNFTDDYPYSWSIPTFHPKTEQFMNFPVCVDKEGILVKNLICPVIVESQPGNNLPDIESLNEAVRYLEDRRNATEPYFLAVGFHKPHVPFKFPNEYLEYHPIENVSLPTNLDRPSSLPLVAWNPWTDIRLRHDIQTLNLSFPFGPMPGHMTRKIIQAYNAATTYVDDLVGKLLKHVDSNTIVVVTADHGWSRGEHGEFSKFSNFDEATKVPLIIHIPGLSSGEVISDALVELVDIFPTLVDLTQVAEALPLCSKHDNRHACTEGRSLAPYMAYKKMGKMARVKSAVFTQYPRPGIQPTLHPNSDKPRLKEIKIMGYSIRTNTFRYTEWVKFDPHSFQPNWKKVYAKELYNHIFDKKEDLNLADRYEMKDIMENLHRRLKLGWRHA